MTRRHDQRRSDGPDRGALSLHRVSKRYGDVVAVDEVSLDVEPGEFVTLLGPSGSGKTTTLRIIAGFVKNDGGEVVLDGRQLTGVPPYKRDVGMVFQNYALFPHLTVFENVAFGLRRRSVPKDEIPGQVARMLGVRVGLMLTLGWGIASVIGALAGMLAAPPFIYPNVLDTIFVFGLTAAVIGGLDNPFGAILGGFVLGVSLSYVSGYMGPEVMTLAALVILIVVLSIRPDGLFSPPTARKV
jgi:branched-chain amino acid transport system permease protein